MTLGTVVIAGRTYQVTGLRLHGGKIRITAHGLGPAPAVTGQPATIFGDDGIGVCQSWDCNLPGLAEDECVHIDLPIQIAHLEVVP
jgi:hypothetical protein